MKTRSARKHRTLRNLILSILDCEKGERVTKYAKPEIAAVGSAVVAVQSMGKGGGSLDHLEPETFTTPVYEADE